MDLFLLSASQTVGATVIKKSNPRVSHVLMQDIRYSWSLENVEKSEYRTRIHFTCSKWTRECCYEKSEGFHAGYLSTTHHRRRPHMENFQYKPAFQCLGVIPC